MIKLPPPSGNLSRRRHGTRELAPIEQITGLGVGHPAVVEGRTLFPSTVVLPAASPRFLISGQNNSKIGADIIKGPWAGMKVFMLTLEERKTCPRSCAQWLTCYGSAMHLARRHDAFHEDFIPALAAEVITTVREAMNERRRGRDKVKGVVIRLHVLGDFYSVRYVAMWAHLLAMLPDLHIYGYTARRVDQDDAESRRIARAIEELRRAWSRFAVRTSHTEVGPGRAIVVDAPLEHPDVIMCPAQTKATETCGTCALCWSPAARGKTIAFLRHGMRRPTGPRKPK